MARSFEPVRSTRHACGVRCLFGLLIAIAACGGSQKSKLTLNGDNDEGGGELARSSIKLSMDTHDDTQGFDDEDTAADAARSRRAIVARYGDPYGGDIYGGDPYGGDPYGGNAYANWRMPQWNYSTPNRTPSYQITVGLPGSIEGNVSWNGPLPTKVASPCGPLDNPTLRVSSDKRVRGVIVYIEKIEVGRATPYFTRPASVGGVLAKHGCTLAPTAQIVAPLPGSVEVHGDATRAKIRIAPPKGAAKSQDIEEGGLLVAEVTDGVTKVDGDDGKLGAAWVIGLDTPYFSITDDSGHYRIDELATGTYDVTFWQPPIAAVAHDGTWSYGAPIVVHRKVTVGAKTAQLSVVLSPPGH
jgi:hypothetical protein